MLVDWRFGRTTSQFVAFILRQEVLFLRTYVRYLAQSFGAQGEHGFSVGQVYPGKGIGLQTNYTVPIKDSNGDDFGRRRFCKRISILWVTPLVW